MRFFTPAFAAAECTNPGPPVHAYDAPTLMIEPGVPASEVTAAELPRADERPVERDVDDRPPGVGRHVLGGDREVRRCVVHEHVGETERFFGRVERRGDALGLADVAASPRAPWLRSPRSPRVPPARCSSLRLPMTIAAPSRANSDAIALPRPVPAPGHEHRCAVVGAGRERAGADLRWGGESDQLCHVVFLSFRCTRVGVLRHAPRASRPCRRSG